MPLTNTSARAKAASSSLGRLEALEADIANLRAERALDILSATLTKWIDQFYAYDKVIIDSENLREPNDSTAFPIPDSFKEDVIRGLATVNARDLLKSPDFWTSIQGAFTEVMKERRAKLQNELSVMHSLIRVSKLREKAAARKRSSATKNQKTLETSSGEVPAKAMDSPGAESSPDESVRFKVDAGEGPNRDSVGSPDPAVLIQEAGCAAAPEPAALVAPIQVPIQVPVSAPMTSGPDGGGGSASARVISNLVRTHPRGKRHGTALSHMKKVNRVNLKPSAAMIREDVFKATIDDFVLPADPLSAIMNSIVPVYLSDDDHKIFGEVHGAAFDRRGVPQTESDSGVATRPRRPRKSRKIPKAP